MANGEKEFFDKSGSGSQEKQGGGMLKVCGLWKSKTNSGKAVLKGDIGTIRLLIFENDFKPADQAPDFKLFIAPCKDEDREKAGDGFDWLRSAGPKTTPVSDDSEF